MDGKRIKIMSAIDWLLHKWGTILSTVPYYSVCWFTSPFPFYTLLHCALLAFGELKSKNAHGVSLMQRSLFTDSFLGFFLLIYLLIFFWFRLYLDRTRGIIDGFWCEGKCEGRKFTLTLTLILHFLSNRKRSRLQIRFKSICKSKNKGQKIRVKDSVCNPWAFFDLRSVAAGLQDEL